MISELFDVQAIYPIKFDAGLTYTKVILFILWKKHLHEREPSASKKINVHRDHQLY